MKSTSAAKNKGRRNMPQSNGRTQVSDPIRLLATKLHCPSIPARRVQRTHLIQRLNEGLESGCQVTLVSAPAGFGKTTCIGEWVDTLALPVAWLSLDPADDDPGRFFY